MIEEEFFMSIDPGLTGAIIIMNMKGEVLFKEPMPKIEVKKGRNEIDLHELRALFEEFKNAKYCVLEQVSAMPGQGVSSMFKFGQTYGALQAMIIAFNIPIILINPRKWTKEMHDGLDKTMDSKKRSELVFKRLFPKEDVTPRGRSKKPHSGFIDAILMGEFFRRSLNAVRQ